MSQVFTSYSRRDTETVDRIVAEVQKSGIDVWLDRQDIQAGNTWRVQIVEAIDTCPAFVLMLSPNSAASDNVRREIDLAQDAKRTTFVVMLDPVKLPPTIRYQLVGLQFIDVKMIGVEKAVSQLINVLKEHLKTVTPTEDVRRVELVIKGIDLKQFDAARQQQLLDFVSKLTNTSRDQVQLESMSPGSVHAHVRIPAKTAYALKTLALNRDARFKKLDIVSLRLNGDLKYVNIAFGILTTTATIGWLKALWLKTPAFLSSMVGAVVGKLITISLVGAFILALALSAPGLVAPLLATPTQTSTPTPTKTPRPPTITPTFTLTPTKTLTPTITATINVTPNASIRVLEGSFSEIRSCSGTVFTVYAVDPEGVSRVYIEFSVAYYEPVFEKPDQVLELTNVSPDTWSAVFEDHVSRAGYITYWRVVVMDKNRNLTTYYEEGKFSFYSPDTNCK